MLATTLSADPFIGRILTGRVEAGTLAVGEHAQGAVAHRRAAGTVPRVRRSWPSAACRQTPIDEAVAGDIVTIAGMTKATVADTLCALEIDIPLPAQPIDPPTISVTFGINDSPLAGRMAPRCSPA